MNQRNGDYVLSQVASEEAIHRLLESPPLSERVSILIEPGHVMSQEAYQRLVEAQQKQK